MNKPLITLYTPGTRPDLILKASRYDADAIIIDLEDTVPIKLKAQTRKEISSLLPKLDKSALVRVNSEPEFLQDDLEAVVGAQIRGIVLPMAEAVEDIRNADRIITGLERLRSLEPNSIKLLLLIETALGVVRCFDVATAAKRVEAVVFGSAEDGDLQRELKCAFSIDGPELLYSRSKVIVDARAAKLPYVLDGAFSDLTNEKTLRADCVLSKRLGYEGRTLVHPQQLGPAREIYVPSQGEIEYYTRLVCSFEEAETAGKAAIQHEGKLVDYAMYKKAKTFLSSLP